MPKSAQPWVGTLLWTVFEQPDTDAVQAQMRHVLEAVEAKFPKAAAHLDAAQSDVSHHHADPFHRASQRGNTTGEVHAFEEGDLPRRLWRVTQSLPR